MFAEVKKALTRKFGPLPAWAWTAIGGVGLYLYEAHKANSAATSSTTTADVAPTADQLTPQVDTSTSGSGDSSGDTSSDGSGTTGAAAVFDPATGTTTTWGAGPGSTSPATIEKLGANVLTATGLTSAQTQSRVRSLAQRLRPTTNPRLPKPPSRTPARAPAAKPRTSSHTTSAVAKKSQKTSPAKSRTAVAAVHHAAKKKH